MDDLLADFVAETREMLAASEGEIVAWEADPTDRARLDTIFRFVHTVKGNCGFFDFPRLADLSHAAETALSDVRSGQRTADTALVSAVLAIMDRIGDMVDAIEAGQPLPGDNDDALIAALAEMGTAEPSMGPRDAQSVPQNDVGLVSPRSIRLPVDLLDRAMSGVSDMVLARMEVAHRLRSVENAPELTSAFDRLSGILTEVRESISQMRMNQLDHLYQSVPRLVRDLSNELGKQVLVDLQGGEVELDREIMELVRDPLTHIIRNAIDHGIETPQERIAAGKREIGMMTLSARHSGNHIHLSVKDDGRGLNPAKIAEAAIAAGIGTKGEIEKLSAADQQALIFSPGLSTAKKVSSISGRGVGMDVVRANIERLGGVIEVSSEPGEGTTFELRIPLTLSIVPGLTVAIGNQRFAIPQSAVAEIIRTRSADITSGQMGDVRFVEVRETRSPYLSFADVLGLKRGSDDENETDIDPVIIMTQMGGSGRVAFGVDRVIDYEDLVVKPLAPAIKALRCFAGSTILDDGQPLLILDPKEIALANDLADAEENLLASAITPESQVIEDALQQVMLFTNQSDVSCAIRLQLVDRIEHINPDNVVLGNGSAHVAVDGELFPILGLKPDTKPDHKFPSFRLSIDGQTVYYGASAVFDQANIEGKITPLEGEPECEGMFLHAAAPVRLLDAGQISAKLPPAGSGAAKTNAAEGGAA